MYCSVPKMDGGSMSGKSRNFDLAIEFPLTQKIREDRALNYSLITGMLFTFYKKVGKILLISHDK